MTILRAALIAAVMASVTFVAASCGGEDGEADGGQVATQEVLTCGTDPVYRPLAFYNEAGDLVGFDIDLCKAYAEKMGMTHRVKLYQFSGLIPALDAEQIDVEPEMAVTEEREEAVDFTTPVVTQSTAVIVKQDRADFNPSTIEELRGLKVGVRSGTAAETVMSKYPDIPLTRYDTQQDSFQDLILGRIDVVVGENLTGGYEVAHTYPDDLRIGSEPITGGGVQERVDVAAAVRQGNSGLVTRLNDAIREMQSDGTLDRIVKKWFGDISYEPTD